MINTEHLFYARTPDPLRLRLARQRRELRRLNAAIVRYRDAWLRMRELTEADRVTVQSSEWSRIRRENDGMQARLDVHRLLHFAAIAVITASVLVAAWCGASGGLVE